MFSTRTTLTLLLLGMITGAASQLVISGAPPATTAAAPATTTTTAQPAMLAAPADEAKAYTLLSPPPPGADKAQWLQFAHRVKETKTGSRHDNRDYTTPMLPWYVYIARQSPETIYTLYEDHTIGSRTLAHLIQFGLLPDWYEQLEGARKLLLSEPQALINLAVHRSIAFARAELVSLLRENESQKISVSAGPLLFALSGMQDHEVDYILSQMRNGTMRIDPRSLRRLMLEPRLKGREDEMLQAMRTQAENGYNSPKSRSMSSYFLHGAELGAADYVSNLINDVSDNNSQPTNFYCAACALALVSDGLTASSLIDAVKQGRSITIADRANIPTYFESPSEHEYLLSLTEEDTQ